MFTLEEIKEFLNPGWAGSLIGLVSILISFVISFYFYFKSKERKSLVYAIRSLLVLDKEDDKVFADVEILFKKKKIVRLVRTIICIWNDGQKSIRKNEILKPLRLYFFGGKVLSAKILKKSRDVCGININLELSQIDLDFIILERGDGLTLEIIHTDRIIHPLVDGVIEGIESIKGGLFYSLKDIILVFIFEGILALFMIILILLVMPNFITNSYLRFGIDLIIATLFILFFRISEKKRWHLKKARVPEKLFPDELKEFIQKDLE